LIRLLKQLQPRPVVICGCALLFLAGMSALLAWLATIPPADRLLHVTGQLEELTLQDPSTGLFTITLLTPSGLRTFDLDNAHRLVALQARAATPDEERIGRGMPVALDYFAFGRGKIVVDATLGKTKVAKAPPALRSCASHPSLPKWSVASPATNIAVTAQRRAPRASPLPKSVGSSASNFRALFIQNP
jgi:hypothetical protein